MTVITWVIKNFKLFITLVTMVIIPAIVGIYTFVTIVFTSDKVNAEQNKRIDSLDSRFAVIKSQVDENIGITKAVKDDTIAIRDILYKRALEK